jgi:muramoyltetrapeptide carboxypeptidase LdcA involved in peptidoglycan recycling
LTNAPRQSLRPTYTFDDLLQHVFLPLGRRHDLPIAVGLPVGHGPNFAPLPLGARYRLDSAAVLSLIDPDWCGINT